MGNDSWRDTLYGAAIAAVAATVWLFYKPPERSPTPTEFIGRLGVAVIASILVGAVASEVFGASPKLTFGLCGAAGIFGERIFLGLERVASKRYGIDLSDKNGGQKKEDNHES